MIPEVKVNWFFKHVLPQLPKGVDIDAVVGHLKSKGVIKAGGGWKAFSVDPNEDERDEDVVYAQLGDVFDSVVEAVNTLYPYVSQQFTLLVRPSRPPDSEQGSSSKLNSSFVPVDVAERLKKDPNGSYEWYDIAEVSEVKKAEEAFINVRNENVAKVMYNLQQIMSLDPCRRFTFGSTIQNRELRLWFACRGVVLTTRAFDFFTNPDRLVHFFIAFAFSSPTALGWDPTIEYLDIQDGQRRYKITVDDQEFTTVSVLADYAADGTVGRGTRVWLVEDKQGERYVLKDLWLDDDQLPEHTIRAELLQDVLDKCGRDKHAKLLRHILTPHGFEKVVVEGSVDTTDGMMDNQTLSTSSVFDLNTDLPASPRSQSQHPGSVPRASGTLESTQIPAEMTFMPQVPSIRHKYHYRILFKEYGTSLYQEKSLLNVFTTLADLFTALDIIHRSGWVHRDISCGNVYCFQNSSEDHPRGILGDFEYAMRVADTTKHQQRAGTLVFMASEAIQQKWGFMSYPKLRDADVFAPPLARAPFTHIPLHDLESCWWLLIYILIHNDDTDNVLSDRDCVLTRYKLSSSLFSPRPDTAYRSAFMKDSSEMTLEHTGLAPSFSEALSVARAIAIQLHLAFEEAEKPFTSINETAFFIHNRLRSFLLRKEALDVIRNITLKEVRHVAVTQNGDMKRKSPTCDKNDEIQERQSKKFKS
ncbi:hypothetical protein GYMLUDRAFT_39433 [Collybiopsis luxurians FD-317 M1]|nr:hypothetical protein GYMLUDRAFT_39433 [Collybiopsis luxurians FD-317 M1]